MQKTIQRRAQIKRTPIRRVSKKRAAQLREYAKRGPLYLAARPICEVWLNEHGWLRFSDGYSSVITEKRWSADALVFAFGAPRSTEIHHCNKRRGAMLLEESNWLAVCRGNHNRIEQNKKWARANGYLRDF